jgi:hypothetical protein
MNTTFCSRLFQRARHAVGRAADVVDAAHVRVLLEQRARLAVVLARVVLPFAQAHHLQPRKHLVDDVQEAGLALLVRLVAQAARDERHLGRARADEAPDEVARRAPRRAVVQPHEGRAPGVRQV